MRTSILLEKLWIDKKEFITSAELRDYCRGLKMDYASVIHYLIKRKSLVRVFKGIFYVKSIEEIKLGKRRYSHLEIVSRGLSLKGVKNWYFGLHTALKLNNMTHEHFAMEEVVSDSLFRAKPVNIAGYKFRFVKISPPLLRFGIKNENGGMRYSDPEKTILDFIYLSRHGGMEFDRILMDVSDWSENISRNRLKEYSKNYPKTVAAAVKGMTG